MDKLSHYRQLVQQLMIRYSAYKPAHGEIEVETIFDTEVDIGEELIEMGIAREDIVLGFQPPYLRQFTKFAAVS